MNDFIRDKEVDLSKYLPSFLTKDPEFAAKLKAESAEHDNMRKTLIDICNQLFVSTATWGLDRWEKFLDITTDYTQTYESRRQKILCKLQGSQTVTLEFLTKLVNLYVADGQDVVIDHPDTYSIEILHHGGQVLDYDGLEDAINTYIPAHIGHTLLTYTKGRIAVYAAGIVRNCKTMRIGMTLQPNNQISPSTLYAAGAIIHQYHKQTIQAGG